MSFNKQVIKTVQVGKVKQTTVQMSRTDKKTLSIDDIAEIAKSIQSQADKKKENIKMMIRGLNIDKWYTIKNFDHDLNADEIDEYLDGQVHDTHKFNDFFQIHVTIYRQ
jgi:hypothetical protein